jgi:hypothetical protein
MEASAETKAAWFSLALAALVGAGLAAASAYVLHTRALEQMINSRVTEAAGDARLRRRKGGRGGSTSAAAAGHRKANGENGVVAEMGLSSSGGVDNGKTARDDSPSETERCGDSFASLTTIPPGLPRVQTRRDGRVYFYSPPPQCTPLILHTFAPCFAISVRNGAFCVVCKPWEWSFHLRRVSHQHGGSLKLHCDSGICFS